MLINENVSLSEYSTMRLGGRAKYLCHIETENDLVEAIKFANLNGLKTKTIGGGSNIAWSNGIYEGLVIVNCIDFVTVQDTLITVGAGSMWDKVVQKTVDLNLSGIEFLSLIPGSAGATPVQNVGAYGAEIKDVLTHLRAYDLSTNKFVTLQNQDCDFSYRKSRFNSHDSGRFIITEITLQLTNNPPKTPFYKSLQEYFTVNEIYEFTPKTIRNAVINIRSSKLPDPAKIANNGSYFANPVMTSAEYTELLKSFPDAPGWKYGSSIKASAAWLIDNAGFKDFHDPETGMATWHLQPLILVNENASSADDLIKFRDKIIQAVKLKFNITLQSEPEIL